MAAASRLSPRTFYARAFGVVVTVGAGALAFLVLAPIWQPLVWAVLLAALLRPLQRRLSPRLGNRPGLAAALLTVLTVIIVLGPVSGLVAAFGSELANLAEQAQAKPGEPAIPRSLPELREVPVAGASLEKMRKYFGVSPASAREWMAQGASSLLKFVGPLGGKLVIGAVGTLAAFAVMLVILFFGLRDGEAMQRRVGDLVPWPAATRRRLLQHLAEVLRAIVFGSLVTAALQGVLVGLAFAVLGLPAPVVFGALAALLAMVPLGGTALVWGPAVLYLAVEDRWWAAAGLAAWGALLVGTVDNLLRPMLVSGRAEVSTLTVFIGVIGGLGAFGIIGLVLGPMILCLVIALLQMLRERPAGE